MITAQTQKLDALKTEKKGLPVSRSGCDRVLDTIIANPTFSYRWEPTDAMGDDVRFKNYGLAPKSAADFAFLLHGFHFLKDEGVQADF